MADWQPVQDTNVYTLAVLLLGSARLAHGMVCGKSLVELSCVRVVTGMAPTASRACFVRGDRGGGEGL
jgi:hypothetical protein